jgi:hypothetical protein
MSARISLMIAVWIAALLGCSTATPPASRVAATSPPLAATGAVTVSTQPTFQPEPRSESNEPLPQFCQLGTTCLTMDPRPFEACLLSDKSCGDKPAEAILVDHSAVPNPGK